MFVLLVVLYMKFCSMQNSEYLLCLLIGYMYIVQYDILQLRYNSCIIYFSVIFFYYVRDIFYNFDILNNVIDVGLWDMYFVNEYGEYLLFYMLQSFVYNIVDEVNMELMDLVGRIED